MKYSVHVLNGMAIQALATSLLTQLNIISPTPLQQAIAGIGLFLTALALSYAIKNAKDMR